MIWENLVYIHLLFIIYVIIPFFLFENPGQDRYGHTAWHYAVAANSPESLELLRSHTPSTLVVQV